jgi:hypothetical protein
MQLNKRVRASKGSDDEPEEFPTQRRASGPAQGRSRPSDVRHMDRDESAEEEVTTPSHRAIFGLTSLGRQRRR